MDEIKSSFSGVNKLIESYNSKIYIATFVVFIDTYKLSRESEIHSSVFHNIDSAKQYISNLFTSILEDFDEEWLTTDEFSRIRNLKSLYFTDGKFDYLKNDIIEVVNKFSEIIRIYGICYLCDIKEAEIK